jgi:protein O-GlcNAc transferase
LHNKGSTFRTAGRLGDARRALRQALLLEPGLAAAANGLATTFRDLADGAASQTMYRRALILAPEDAARWSNRLYGAHYLPEIDGPALLALHRAWANSNNLEPVERVLSKPSIQTERPLRIGFASPDFAQHPIGYFTLGLFEQADPAKLSIHCYSDRPVEDAVTHRLAKAVPNWRPVAGQSHAAWRQIVQDDALDVLVDLAGHTADGRLLAMAERLAPIQASWAGYVGTTGLPSMDLLIADAHHVQPGEEGWYDEDILRLPHGYVSYTPVANPETLDREPGPLTFACFNNPAKLNDGVLDLWARLLVSVPQARLLLRYRGLDDPAQSGRILERLNFGGVDRSRVLLEAGGGRLEMLQAYRRADVALDPYPYSGGLTTLEALWMGVPVVTLPGQGFAGRHSVSHLTVSGHADWIARDRGDYLGIARELAQKSRSGAINRSQIRERLASSPLMDHAGFAEDFWRAFRTRF